LLSYYKLERSILYT